MDVVTGGRDCPINTNKHTLQLKAAKEAKICNMLTPVISGLPTHR
jgi:hypothetical protein